MTISELKPWQDKMAVVLHLFDGGVTTVNVHFVDAEYQNIIVAVLVRRVDPV